ncbi:MAG: 2-C-methyl-D-erythritol 4-phosphate cytidylyltransferase [Verrucomicrobia bacterium]|nr:MAG: 2-C-methyl-D-erythritol 4-phosphate cytidylyltransferase [Verrucomicrobiota bacterium]TAE86274.1 MAG: 2-C-methyl-D-erythritol 4-phosphate cytidylyltransferase [Verrucomicrobiota bacterium]TAF23058.1 MAG: 2-C-methyl-D-erythritol 4-phosphate cytidylyltransferase [Verrucomicrobiota bacterium]TAF39949.1 MAG: 2-C-methyl-D-erythritol 4-phosphate cytidylyltransferase [Verrucomicrobiota bacterium]
MGCAAIIVASGSSRRMGFDKLAAEIHGTPVLVHTVEAFMAASGITRVIVVCPEERFRLLDSRNYDKPLDRVDGGDQRQDSVASGLAVLGAEELIVAVHDAARPLIRPEAIDQCIAAARQFGAATMAHQVADTLKKADSEGFARYSVERNGLWAMETPQVFRSSLLRRAYAAVRERQIIVTDEVSAVEAMGISTKLITSPFPNPKITVPADIHLATALMR